ncbi:hypothetical protein J1N35_024317 [Gossypium stocksii]|uniref:Uncharacterized protein n=1 Tax=Gossypium stocksii TaxID=47602 RepID=A0A9D3VKU8_9ROSI|nr:hypothetical protein J1N35_024317 [Gossypium stocksii]
MLHSIHSLFLFCFQYSLPPFSYLADSLLSLHLLRGRVITDGTVSWFLDWVRVLFVLVVLGHWFFATRDSCPGFLGWENGHGFAVFAQLL